MIIRQFSGTEIVHRHDELTALFREAAQQGNSAEFPEIGDDKAIIKYWRGVAGETATGRQRLVVALDERGRLVGTALLTFAARPSGRSHAQVKDVTVLSRVRGRGIGAALIARVEQEARLSGRKLLTVDPRLSAGSAKTYYHRLGYAHLRTRNRVADATRGNYSSDTILFKRLRPRLS